MITKSVVEYIIGTYYVENSAPEMLALLEHVKVLSPKIILEIGVCFGGSLRLWEKVVTEGGVVIGIDLHPDVESRITGVIVPPDGRRPSDWEVTRSSVVDGVEVLTLRSAAEVHIVSADSKAPTTFEVVRQLLGDREIDFFFHDGAHYGVGPVYDYANFEELIRTGGLVCVADTSDPRTQVDNLGTAALWRAFPEPKIPLVKPVAQGMSLWTKTENFRINPLEIIEREGLEGDDSWNYLPIAERPTVR